MRKSRAQLDRGAVSLEGKWIENGKKDVGKCGRIWGRSDRGLGRNRAAVVE